MVAGPFDADKRVEILKPAAFTILLNILDQSSLPVRTEALARIALMIERSHSNLAVSPYWSILSFRIFVCY